MIILNILQIIDAICNMDRWRVWLPTMVSIIAAITLVIFFPEYGSIIIVSLFMAGLVVSIILEKDKKLKESESLKSSDWKLWAPFLLSLIIVAYLTFKFPENFLVIVFSSALQIVALFLGAKWNSRSKNDSNSTVSSDEIEPS
jgi:hypothetical protein